jgi:hypothetical protein
MNTGRITKFIILLLGLSVLGTAILLQNTFPKEAAWMPEGFHTPVLAFEFLKTNEEVKEFFGPDRPERDQFIEQMNKGHQYDTIFLVISFSFQAARA